MRNLFLLLSLLLTSTISFSQEHRALLGFGGSISYNQRPNFDYYKPIPGLNFEMGYAYKKNGWITNSSLGFQQKGFRQRLLLVDTSGVIVGEGPDEVNRHNYFYLAQHFGYEITKKWTFSFSVGANISSYFGSKITAPDFEFDGHPVTGYNLSINNLTRFDASISLNFGIGKNDNLILFNFQRSLNQINYDPFASDSPWKNLVFSLKYVSYIKLNTKKVTTE